MLISRRRGESVQESVVEGATTRQELTEEEVKEAKEEE